MAEDLPETPAVSVVIPAYNADQLLAEAIDSVLAQSWRSFEVVVVDDGSTDATRHVVQRYTDPRVRYVYQDNQGLGGARNTGIRASRGRYLAFLDADDTFLPHKLALQAAVLDEQPQVGLVASGWIDVDSRGTRSQEVRPWERRPHLQLRDLLMDCPFQPNGVLLRREWLERVGLFDPSVRGVEDWDLWLRLARAGCGMVWLERPVGTYRVYVGSMSSNAALMRAGLLRALDKLFADDSLPADIAGERHAAYGWAYANAAARSFAVGDIASAAADLARAIDCHPALATSEVGALVAFLGGWSHHLMVADAVRFLRTVEAQLPARASLLRRRLRHAIAEEYIGRAFERYAARDLAATRRDLAAALHADASFLTNRGVLSIGVEAVLGARLTRPARRFGRLLYRHAVQPAPRHDRRRAAAAAWRSRAPRAAQ